MLTAPHEVTMALQRAGETASMVETLSEELRQPGDAALIREILANYDTLQECITNREYDQKAAIKAMTENVASLEATAKDPPNVKVTAQKEQLASQKGQIENDIQHKQQEIQRRKGELALVDATNSELEQQRTKMADPANSRVPGVKHTIKLCTSVTNVTWDYDSKDVKGVVHLTNKKAIKPFAFPAPADRTARAEVANAIWDLCWLDQAPAKQPEAVPISVGTRVA